MNTSLSDGPVFVTGGSGFVGRYVVRALVRAGHGVRVLVHRQQPDFAAGPSVTTVCGDILDGESLRTATRGCSAVIHLVGIIQEQRSDGVTFERIHVEGTRNVVQAAQTEQIDTFLHMSANGAAPSARTRYQRTKADAESVVRSAGFAHATVFRPSLIFGRPEPGQPEFCTQLIRTLIRPFPIWPVFGDGSYLLQPIAVEDVARAFSRALKLPVTSDKIYCLAGSATFSYTEILSLLAAAAGRPFRPVIRQPLWFARPLIRLLEPTGLIPITAEQLEMLVDGNTCDSSAYLKDFAPRLKPFAMDSLGYLKD